MEVEPPAVMVDVVPLCATSLTDAGASAPLSSLFVTLPLMLKTSSARFATSSIAIGPSSATLIVMVVLSMSPVESVATMPNVRVIISFGSVPSA